MEDDTRITRAIVGALRERDLSGYELWRWLGPVHGSSGHELNEANLYPLLYSLEASGLIESYWRENGDTRRAYRIAGRALVVSEKRGWVHVVSRRATTAAYVSPEPDETLDPIVWADPLRLPGASEAGHAEQHGAAPGPKVDHPAAADPEIAAADDLVATWLDGFVRHLRLDDLHARDVASEIADHIADNSHRLRGEGMAPARAVAASLGGLGPVDGLAKAVSASQHNRRRLARGAARGLAVGIGTSLGAFVVALVFLYAVVAAVEQIMPLLAAAGLHLYIDDTAELRSEEVAIAGCAAAFVAARRSLTTFAIHSRRAESSLGLPWGLAGALVLLGVALIVPLPIHPLSYVTLLAIPFCCIAGALRPHRVGTELAPRSRLVLAAIVLSAVTLAPGLHAWIYDPQELPAAAAPLAASPPAVSLDWQRARNSDRVAVRVDGLDGAAWRDARVELWPTVRDGVAIRPLRSATHPAISMPGADRFSFMAVSRAYPEWLVTVSATGPDGARHTILAQVRLGYPTHATISIFDWLSGHHR